MRLRTIIPPSLLYFCLLFFVTTSLSAQLSFEKIMGSPYTDELYWVSVTPSGDYVVTGYVGNGPNIGQSDMVIGLLDPAGNTQWMTGIPGNGLDFGCSVKPCQNGGYIVTGYTSSYGLNGDPDMILCRLDASGQIQWTRTYGTNNYDIGEDVIETSDGHFMVVGSGDIPGTLDRDILVVKVDSTGNTVWEQHIGESGEELGQCIQETPNGDYLIAGRTASFNGQEFVLTKMDPTGNIQWTKSYDLGVFHFANSIAMTPDSGCVIFGNVNGNYALIKTNASGDAEWAKTYNHTFQDQARTVLVADSGGYIFTGYSYTNMQDLDVVKVDAQGNIRWAKVLSGNSNAELAIRMTRDPARGEYLVAGARSGPNSLGGTDGYLLRFDESGNTGCTDTTFSPSVSRDTPMVSIRTFMPITRNTAVSHTIQATQPTVLDSTLCDTCQHNPGFLVQDSILCAAETLYASFSGNPAWVDDFAWQLDGTSVGTTADLQTVPSQTGVQQVQLTISGGGCADSSVQAIRVQALPTPDFSFSSTLLVVDFQDLSSTQTGSITGWLWHFGDGDSATTQNPTHTYDSTGTYTVCLEVFDAEGCSWDTCQSVSVVEVSREKDLLVAPLKLYPNPATDQVKVELPSPGHQWKITLVDLMGRTFPVPTTHLPGGQDLQLNVGGFPAGTYLLRLRDNQLIYQQKLILKE